MTKSTCLSSRYDAGDHVAIYPTNDPELVEKIGQILNIDLDAVFSLVNKDGELLADVLSMYTAKN